MSQMTHKKEGRGFYLILEILFYLGNPGILEILDLGINMLQFFVNKTWIRISLYQETDPNSQ
jgi:hypothetical protein